MLEELFVDGFDNDQIWEEIHMQNTPFLTYLKAEIKNLKFSKKAGAQPKADLEDEDQEAEGEEDEADMSLDLDEDMGLEMDDTEGFSGEDDLEEGSRSEGSGEDQEDLEEGEEDDDEEEEEEDLDDLDLPVKKKSRTSEVDDDFFNLDEFNAMTEKQEQDELDEKEPDEDEEEIDYFADPDMIESGDDDFDENMEENENEVDAHGTSACSFYWP